MNRKTIRRNSGRERKIVGAVCATFENLESRRLLASVTGSQVLLDQAPQQLAFDYNTAGPSPTGSALDVTNLSAASVVTGFSATTIGASTSFAYTGDGPLGMTGVFPEGNFEAWLDAATAGIDADAKLEFFFRLA